MQRRMVCGFLGLICLLSFHWTHLHAQEAESLEEAKVLYKEAIELKKTGKIEESVKQYEKALRTNRKVLGFDDDGLIATLKETYEKRLASAPTDIPTLEGLGFISAVCFSDFEKAISYYQKVMELATEEKVKTRTKALIDRLQAQWSMVKLNSSMGDNRNREERVKEWNQMEKQDSLAAVSERVKNREERIRALSKTKEDLETRLPAMEDKLKELEDERDKADLLWRTTENRMYRRKRERLETDIDTQKRDIVEGKKKLEQGSAELDKLTAEAEADQNTLGTGSGKGSGSGDSQDPQGGEPNPDNPTGSETGSDSGSGEPNPGPIPGVGSPDDPALPPGDNPDFPADKGSATGEGSGETKWP